LNSQRNDNVATTGGAAARRVTLVRGRHRWTLECGPGEEAHLLRLVTEYAAEPAYPLDRFDAAVISHQLSNRAVCGLNKVPDKAD
jgi:hypothetical protein